MEGGVEWRRARLYAALTVADYIDFKFMYDFAAGNPPNLKDAYVDFSKLPIPFQIRGGRFKNPLGVELATGANAVPLCMTTHIAQESMVQKALDEIKKLDIVTGDIVLLHVEE